MLNETTSYLGNQFLIAMPQLEDPNFAHTLTYICEHNADGAMGIVVNKPLSLNVGEILEHIGIENPQSPYITSPVFSGGPVQSERGFVLHRSDTRWEGTTLITEEISLTTSRDILEAIAFDQGPDLFFLALGYAGWGAGQLEKEMAANAWLSTPADNQLIFDCPVEQRWQRAALQMGVDLNLLSTHVGHA